MVSAEAKGSSTSSIVAPKSATVATHSQKHRPRRTMDRDEISKQGKTARCAFVEDEDDITYDSICMPMPYNPVCTTMCSPFQMLAETFADEDHLDALYEYDFRDEEEHKERERVISVSNDTLIDVQKAIHTLKLHAEHEDVQQALTTLKVAAYSLNVSEKALMKAVAAQAGIDFTHQTEVFMRSKNGSVKNTPPN